MNKTEQKIKEYKNISDGWHYGNGGAPDEKIIQDALIINEKLNDIGFPSTNSFLSEDGDIQVNGYWHDNYLELFVDSDGGIDFLIEKNDLEIFYKESITLTEVLSRINYWGLKWFTSDLSKHQIMISSLGGLHQLPSVYQVLGVGAQLSKSLALRMAGEVNAIISKPSTLILQKSLPYTSGFQNQSFQTVST